MRKQQQKHEEIRIILFDTPIQLKRPTLQAVRGPRMVLGQHNISQPSAGHPAQWQRHACRKRPVIDVIVV